LQRGLCGPLREGRAPRLTVRPPPPRVPYRLLVCDLDGTLLDHGTDLDLALVDGLRRARERGLIVSIATGRMPPGVDRYRDELGITAPMIFYNGALVRDHEAGHDLMALTLPRGILWEVHDVIAHAPVDPLFYRDDLLYCLAESFATRTYSERQSVSLEVIDAPGDFLRMGASSRASSSGTRRASRRSGRISRDSWATGRGSS